MIVSWLARCWLPLTIVLAAFAILIDTFFVQGLFLPVRIVGASMAERLCGEHLLLSCPNCRREFKVDAAGPGPRDQAAICPSCAARDVPLDGARRMPGDRVFIDRLSGDLRAFRRFDVVAARQPGNEKRLVVKRIVGLPDQRIGIREGELFVDGRRYEKSAAEKARVYVESPRHPADDSIAYNQFRQGAMHPIRIENVLLQLSSGKMERDLYYLDPRGGTADWEMEDPLGENEYFLLGDNPAASIDSRHWPRPVRREEIVGRVIR